MFLSAVLFISALVAITSLVVGPAYANNACFDSLEFTFSNDLSIWLTWTGGVMLLALTVYFVLGTPCFCCLTDLDILRHTYFFVLSIISIAGAIDGGIVLFGGSQRCRGEDVDEWLRGHGIPTELASFYFRDSPRGETLQAILDLKVLWSFSFVAFVWLAVLPIFLFGHIFRNRFRRNETKSGDDHRAPGQGSRGEPVALP